MRRLKRGNIWRQAAKLIDISINVDKKFFSGDGKRHGNNGVATRNNGNSW